MPAKKNRGGKKGKGLASPAAAASNSDVEDMLPGTVKASAAMEVSDNSAAHSSSESEEEGDSSRQGSEVGDAQEEDQQLLTSDPDEEEAPRGEKEKNPSPKVQQTAAAASTSSSGTTQAAAASNMVSSAGQAIATPSVATLVAETSFAEGGEVSLTAKQMMQALQLLQKTPGLSSHPNLRQLQEPRLRSWLQLRQGPTRRWLEDSPLGRRRPLHLQP